MAVLHNMESFIKLVSNWEKKFGRRLPVKGELMCIMNFQNIKSVQFKENICSYYSIFAGVQFLEYDDSVFSFWDYKLALDRAKEDLCISNKLWPFADWAYDANIYACCYESTENTQSGLVYVIIGGEIFEIAKSMDNFFKLLLTDPEEVGVF